MIHQIASWLEPWKSLYSDSTAISSAVTGVHILALVVSGGLAISADRMTLRALRAYPDDRRVLLRELHHVHRPVIIGLSVLFVSGVLLWAADFETFVASPVFWIKMLLIAGLLANGVVLYRADEAVNSGSTDDPHTSVWRRLKLSTRISLFFWITITVAGAVLPAAA